MHEWQGGIWYEARKLLFVLNLQSSYLICSRQKFLMYYEIKFKKPVKTV